MISPRELPKLKVLEWRDKKGTLDCNASLVKILKEAKSVKVNSGSISQAFVINLLSTAIEIEELELSGTNDAVKLDSIPIMELLDLQHLSLDVVPSATEEDEVFWDYLLAPSLETLWLGSFNPLHSGLSEFGENLVAFRFHSFMQWFRLILLESVKVEAGVEVRKDERRQGMICVSLDVEAVAIRVGEEDRLKRVGKQEERR